MARTGSVVLILGLALAALPGPGTEVVPAAAGQGGCTYCECNPNYCHNGTAYSPRINITDAPEQAWANHTFHILWDQWLVEMDGSRAENATIEDKVQVLYAYSTDTDLPDKVPREGAATQRYDTVLPGRNGARITLPEPGNVTLTVTLEPHRFQDSVDVTLQPAEIFPVSANATIEDFPPEHPEEPDGNETSSDDDKPEANTSDPPRSQGNASQRGAPGVSTLGTVWSVACLAVLWAKRRR